MENKRIFSFIGMSIGLAGLLMLSWIATTRAAVPAAPADIAEQRACACGPGPSTLVSPDPDSPQGPPTQAQAVKAFRAQRALTVKPVGDNPEKIL